MRIHTRVEFAWDELSERYVVAREEGYDYEGPVEWAGGGPSPEQRAAAAAQANLANTTAASGAVRDAREQEQYAAIQPYAFSRLNKGLPFYDSLTDPNSVQTAKAYAPARADILRRTSTMGPLPSGFRERLLGNVDAARGRAFDEGMTNTQFANENSKAEAARLITGQQQIANPVPYYSASSGANNSIMQAPLQTPGMAGILGGFAGAAAKAFF